MQDSHITVQAYDFIGYKWIFSFTFLYHKLLDHAACAVPRYVTNSNQWIGSNKILYLTMAKFIYGHMQLFLHYTVVSSWIMDVKMDELENGCNLHIAKIAAHI